MIYVVGVLKKRPRLPESCPAFLRAIITECWQEQPDNRPPFSIIHWQLQVLSLLQSPQIQMCSDIIPEIWKVLSRTSNFHSHEELIRSPTVMLGLSCFEYSYETLYHS